VKSFVAQLLELLLKCHVGRFVHLKESFVTETKAKQEDLEVTRAQPEPDEPVDHAKPEVAKPEVDHEPEADQEPEADHADLEQALILVDQQVEKEQRCKLNKIGQLKINK
jgi:hypothetical protein